MPGKCFGDFFKFGEESRSEKIVKAERSISRHARRILHSALAKDFAFPLLGEIACVPAGFAAFVALLDSTGYEVSQDDLLIFRWNGGLGVDVVTTEAFEN